MKQQPTFDDLFEAFTHAVSLEPDERRAWLEDPGALAPDMRAELESLLAARSSSLLDADGPLAEEAGSLLEEAVPELLTEGPLPSRVASYEIVRELGRGGMGVVYLARQADPDRLVAIKLLREADFGGSERQRFRREARVLGQLAHDGIARIHEAGIGRVESSTGISEAPFIAMEFVEGVGICEHASLRELDLAARLTLLSRVADAVQHAHDRGVIHRDLKPTNILVTAEGRPKILDFGVARATTADGATLQTRTGQIIGTLPYMSPEQVRGSVEDIDARVDVYAMGVLAFELLTDRLPIETSGLSLAEAALAIRDQTPPQLSTRTSRFPADVETIVATALAKEPERRYASAATLAADIRRHLAHRPITARPPTAGYRAAKLLRRHRGLASGLAVAFLVLVTGVIVSTTLAVQASRLATEADERRVLSERRQYVARIAVARHDAAAGDWAAVARGLEDAPAEHRGWEWRHLAARIPLQRAFRVRDHVSVGHRPDGTPLALVADQGFERLVKADDGEILASFGGHRTPPDPRGPVCIGTIAPDGRHASLFDRTRNETVVLDTTTSEVVWKVSGAQRMTFGNGITACIGSKTLTIRDRTTGSPRGQTGLDDPEVRIAIAPDGSALTTNLIRGDVLQLHDPNTGAITRRLPVPSILDVAWHPGGDRLAVLTTTGLRIIDREGAVHRALDGDRVGESIGLRFLGDRHLIASRPDKVARLFDLTSGELIAAFDIRSHVGLHPVVSASLSPDRRELLLGDRLGFRFAANPMAPRMAHETYAYRVAFDATGELLASVDFSGMVHLWDTRTRTLVARRDIGRGSPYSLYFTRGGTMLETTGSHPMNRQALVSQWDLLTGEVTQTYRPQEEWLSDLPPGCNSAGRYASCPQGRVTAVVDDDGNVIVRVNGTGSFTISPPGGARGLSIAPSGRSIAVGSNAAGPIEIWNVAEARIALRLDGHDSECFDLAFSPDETRLVSGGRDGAVVWDLTHGESVLRITDHDSYVHGVAFSADGSRIATASGDFTVRIWDTETSGSRLDEARRAEALRQRLTQTLGPRLREHPARALLDASPAGEREALLRLLIEQAAR